MQSRMYFTSLCFEREILNLFELQRFKTKAAQTNSTTGLHAIAPIQRTEI
jgi:hypothetical protein